MPKTMYARLATVTLVMAATPSCAGGPGDLATGDVLLNERDGHPDDQWTLEFDVRGEPQNGTIRDAEGSVSAERPEGHEDEGDYWTADVLCALPADDGTVLFGGPLGDRTANRDWGYVMLRVEDGGTPGAGNHVVWIGFANTSRSLAAHCGGDDRTTELWDAIDGNLQVNR